MSLKKIAVLTAGMMIAMGTLAACGGSDDPGEDTTAPVVDTPDPTEPDPTEPDPDPEPPSTDALIGITMPDRALERWNRDGEKLQADLQAMGYQTDLQYGDNKPEQQVSQIENQINAGATILVIASIDSNALAPVLQTAAEQGIVIIAYDRLLMDTENVDYYATFDNVGVGTMQGEFMRDTADLDNAEGPFNFEAFTGSDDDNNAKLFFQGAWDVLKPYYDDGKLVCPSGKCPETVDSWTDVSIRGWSTEDAQTEMENRLNSFYADKKVDIVLSPNDSLAFGIASALDAAGYVPGEDWPLLTGQDADEANVKNILAGKQSMSVFKDTRILAGNVATMVDEIAKGGSPSGINGEYDNNVKMVPTVQAALQAVTKDTVQAVLIDSGFYTADQLGL